MTVDETMECTVGDQRGHSHSVRGVKSTLAVSSMVDSDDASSFSTFSHLLDARILRALADMGFARPTLVQLKAIPIALENRDILAKAKTGSGKTAAYCIPVVQKVLIAKNVCVPGPTVFFSVLRQNA